MSYYDYGYPKYVSAAEKREKNRKAAAKLAKKNKDIEPVVVEGSKLLKTWWGKAWADNLKLYSDYSNRLGRGSSYLRQGAVLDLKISSGTITALVQGSKKKPYNVRIEIKPLEKKTWEAITVKCEGKIESLQELIDGKFPKALGELFTAKGKGLFPSPDEIRLGCDCPDWADMCKHIVAALYGVGVRLDSDPGLFFTLREVRIDDLISKAVTNRTDTLLKKSARKSKRVIKDEAVSELFDIDIDEK